MRPSSPGWDLGKWPGIRAFGRWLGNFATNYIYPHLTNIFSACPYNKRAQSYIFSIEGFAFAANALFHLLSHFLQKSFFCFHTETDVLLYYGHKVEGNKERRERGNHNE